MVKALGGGEEVEMSNEKGEAKSLETGSDSESEVIKTPCMDCEAMPWKYASAGHSSFLRMDVIRISKDTTDVTESQKKTPTYFIS